MAVPDTAWIGIDAGELFHHAIDGDGAVLWSQQVPNDQAAIERLIAKAASTAVHTRWAVDLTCAEAALLLALPVIAGQSVVCIPGKVVNRMSGAFTGEGKTDARDAHVIANTARMRRDLAEVSTPDELITELAVLVGHREDLMTDWVRGVNRLRSPLTRVFPALERALDHTTRIALTLVAGYCSPSTVREAGEHGLSEHLRAAKAHRASIPAVVRKALAAASAQTVVLPGEQTIAVLIRALARQLLELDREIKNHDKLIVQRFREHPQAEIIVSTPGTGPILGAEFLAITAGDLAAFGSAARLATYAGLAPVPNDSGQRTGVLHKPTRYHRRLRHVFYTAAFSSIKNNGPSRDFYRRKRTERQRHTKAVVALARRLVDVLWALLRDNRTWQPTAPTAANAT